MDRELIITLVGTILTVLLLEYKDRKSKNRFEGWQNNINEILASLLNRLNIVEDSEKKIKDADKFRNQFRNDVSEKVAIMVMSSENLAKSKTIISAITEFSKSIAEFGLKFNYSGYRKNDKVTEDDFYNYLHSDIDSILFNFINTIEQDFDKVEKGYLHGSTLRSITFVDYLLIKESKEPNIMAICELLIMRLVKNGINEIELKMIFLKFIHDFISQFKKKYLEFIAMPDYLMELEKKM